MPVGRKRLTALAAVALLGGSLGLNAAGPASADPKPEPKIDTVKQRVTRLYDQAEQASERYNTAREQLKASQVRLTALDADLARQKKVVGSMRDDVARLVVDQYQGHALSSASEVVFSPSPEAFVDNLNAVSSYNSRRGELVKEYAVQLTRLKLRTQAADDQVAALTKTRAVLKTQKERIDDRAAKAKALLSDLEEKQRLALMAGVTPTDLPSIPASGRASAAVRYAMSKVGHGYVWGAAGPSVFDCSGLMMAAWGSAGVGLPHSSSAQQGSGRHVSESELRPGDLVFYYSPVHHVGMYIGNGLIVHAANPGAGVRVDGLHTMPYSGAVRPG